MDRKWNTKTRTGPTLIQQIIHFNHNLVRADEHLIHDCVVKYAYVHVSYGVLFSWNEHSLHDRATTNRSFAWWMHHKNDVKRTQPSYYNYTCQLQIFTFISWINNQFALALLHKSNGLHLVNMQRTFCMDFKRISHYDFKLLYDTDSINLVARNYIHCVVTFNCLPKLQEATFMNFQSYHIFQS